MLPSFVSLPFLATYTAADDVIVPSPVFPLLSDGFCIPPLRSIRRVITVTASALEESESGRNSLLSYPVISFSPYAVITYSFISSGVSA